MGHNLKFKKMEIPEAIKLIQEMKSWMPSDNKNFDKEREAIDTVVAEIERPLPTDEKTVCPECLKKCTNEELKMFGGLCEECSTDFN